MNIKDILTIVALVLMIAPIISGVVVAIMKQHFKQKMAFNVAMFLMTTTGRPPEDQTKKKEG